jgi:hypothetical protein
MCVLDLNDLLYRHQISLMRASSAASVEAKCAHVGLARGYGREVQALQARLGAAMTLATPICSTLS